MEFQDEEVDWRSGRNGKYLEDSTIATFGKTVRLDNSKHPVHLLIATVEGKDADVEYLSQHVIILQMV